MEDSAAAYGTRNSTEEWNWVWLREVSHYLRQVLLHEIVLYISLFWPIVFFIVITLFFCIKHRSFTNHSLIDEIWEERWVWNSYRRSRTASTSLVVLRIYFGGLNPIGFICDRKDCFAHSNPFISTCVWLTFLRGFQTITAWCFYKFVLGKPRYEEVSVPKTSLYHNEDKGFFQLWLCFGSQSSLFVLYVYYLNFDPRTHDLKCVNFFMWFTTIMVLGTSEKGELGREFSVARWYGACKEMDIYTIQRVMMDFVSNGIVRELIKFTAPILLCVSEDPMSFIKDVLAVFFITKLDDREETEEGRGSREASTPRSTQPQTSFQDTTANGVSEDAPPLTRAQQWLNAEH